MPVTAGCIFSARKGCIQSERGLATCLAGCFASATAVGAWCGSGGGLPIGFGVAGAEGADGSGASCDPSSSDGSGGQGGNDGSGGGGAICQ